MREEGKRGEMTEGKKKTKHTQKCQRQKKTELPIRYGYGKRKYEGLCLEGKKEQSGHR